MRPTHHFGFRSSRLLSTAALVSAAALGSTAALATEPTETPPSLTVNYVQSDLQDSATAQALYQRIQRAARIVCQQPSSNEVVRYHLYKACYDRAVDTAVANVGATALTAVHRSHSRTQAAG
jgi:UrcA family protein